MSGGGILVSVWRAPGSGLARMHLANGRVDEIELAGGMAAHGMSGLAAAGDRVYAVQHALADPATGRPTDRNALLVLDAESLAVVGRHVLELGRDVHSIAVADGAVFAVSTGTDEVLALRLRGDRVVDERPFWRPDPSLPRADHHHLNAIMAGAGDLFVSGFGRRAHVERWSSARDGFIVGLESGRTLVHGIYQPHSVTALPDGLGYCESPLAAARLPAGRSCESLPGYTRGMCAAGREVLVGTSPLRQRAAGIDAGCRVVRIHPERLAVEPLAQLSGGGEIYDLLPEAA
jgi:uncharacterized protein DUF4915